MAKILRLLEPSAALGETQPPPTALQDDTAGAMLTLGTPSFRPMTPAMSRKGTPPSATACSRVPADADSTASR